MESFTILQEISLADKRPTQEQPYEESYEYSKMCNANMFLGIRLRDTGRVFTFLADSTGFWSGLDLQLVGLMLQGDSSLC